MLNKFFKKYTVLFKKPGFWLGLLVLITFIAYLPAFKMEFWWVDDGWDILVSKQILESIAGFNLNWVGLMFNEGGGRLRAVYWLYQSFEYLIGGNNPTIHFLVHYSVILIGAVAIFKIVYLLTKSGFVSFFSSVLYFLIPVNTENIFRLGPQEPLLGMFLAASFYFLLKKRTYLSIFLLLLAILTKENGFVAWIAVSIYYVAKRLIFEVREKSLEKYSLWGAIFTIPVILNTLLRRGGYSGFYTFEVDKIIGHFESYLLLINEAFSPLLMLLLITYIFRLVVAFWDKKYKKYREGLLIQGMFLLLFLGLIAVQSPWAFVMNRYVMPATIGIVVFLGMEIVGVKRYLIQMQKGKFLTFFGIILGVYLTSFLWINVAHVFLSGQLSSHQTSFIQSLYSNLATETPEGGTILLNFKEIDSTKELVVETEMHLDLFYSRSDIQVDYLRLGKLPDSDFIIVGTPQVVEGYPVEEIEQTLKKYKKDESLAKNDKFIVLTTPVNLFKQVTKKSYQFVTQRKPFTSEGIYTYYISQDYWYKYYSGN